VENIQEGEAAVKRNRIKPTDGYRLYLNYHEGLSGYARGTYEAKPWLKTAAKRVDKRAKRYRQQYQGCAESLKPGFWRRLFSW